MWITSGSGASSGDVLGLGRHTSARRAGLTKGRDWKVELFNREETFLRVLSTVRRSRTPHRSGGLQTPHTMRLPVCCCLLLLVAGIRGQDEFSLGDAFDDHVTTKPPPDHDGGITDDTVDITRKPTPKPQPAKPGVVSGVDDFDLSEAVGGEDKPLNPTPKPNPGQGGGGAGRELDDSDLAGAGEHPAHPDGHDNNPGGHDKPSGRALHPSAGADGQDQGEGKQSVVAGIVSAVAVAAVGAVSSFIAYQKKKLCFKGAAEDPENVNMESHKGDQSEPQVQSTLLEK